eukprot:CAMPEP_0180805368 /NCGR_PEP_ID=MMETSP1038_2-20121128/61980_1 /TAXON_ID=632150 /ORGANISM="Azadinium spinosum, Strain 3D9" /LENGTH=88 /DNA_ID=CAMNT_0022845919 /DNA_START=27 /DNA_END=290 /DNA_ORIENTATION=-
MTVPEVLLNVGQTMRSGEQFHLRVNINDTSRAHKECAHRSIWHALVTDLCPCQALDIHQESSCIGQHGSVTPSLASEIDILIHSKKGR